MCGPILPLAGAINTIDQTRKNVLGWQGKGEKKQQVTNNYYGAQDATTVPDTPNRDLLKSDTPQTQTGHTGSTTNKAY